MKLPKITPKPFDKDKFIKLARKIKSGENMTIKNQIEAKIEEYEKKFTETELDNFYSTKTTWKHTVGVPFMVKDFLRQALTDIALASVDGVRLEELDCYWGEQMVYLADVETVKSQLKREIGGE